MKKYFIEYYLSENDTERYDFVCEADSPEQAIEQLKNAHPNSI